MSLVCITETWFKEYIENCSVSIQGFSLERKDRLNGRGGGVGCYVINDIDYLRLNNLEVDNLESYGRKDYNVKFRAPF